MPGRILLIIIASVFIVSGLTEAEEIRNPAVEGSFYPAQVKVLRNMIKRFLDKVDKKKIEEEVMGLIAPHAGYIYSGQVAGYAYKQIQGKEYDTVILLGPSHRVMFNGASVGNYDAYKTPLGKIPVDKKLAKELIAKNERIKFLPSAHKQEHSLEVQLPFVQIGLGDFKILPIVIGSYDLELCKMLSKSLYKVTKGKKVFFIASTDLSHYHPYKEAVEIDQKTIQAIKKMDAESFYKGIKKGEYELCGSAPVITLLCLAKKLGVTQIELLNYSNSGEVPFGNKSRVVGYSALALIKKESSRHLNSNKGKKDIQTFEYLNEEEQNIVLNMARKSIQSYVRERKIPEFDYSDYPHLKEKRGVFVTLYKNGNLRGCIGRHESDKPLYELVPEMAVASAFYDRRFPSLKKEELDDINIEVSVYLSKLVKIKDINQYKLGKHGIILRKGFRGATYLPKVPIEQGWTKEETLNHLCLKAGLSPHAWQDETTEFYIYSTQVIKE